MFGAIARLRSPRVPAAPERTAGDDRERFRDAYWARRAPYGRGDVADTACWKGAGTSWGSRSTSGRPAGLVAAGLAGRSEVDRAL